MRIKRALAVSTALVVAALGTSAVTAEAAFAGQGKGQAKHAAHQAPGQEKKQDKQDKQDKQGKKDKKDGTSSADKSNNGKGKGHDKPHGNGGSNGGGSGATGGGKGGKGGGHNPPGNNGTIKVDALPFDDAPNNEPHVGCQFQIDFYGFDQGDLYADVIFEAHAPTTSPSGNNTLLTDSVFIGEDDASGGGSEAGLDASKTYTLDFGDITPHNKQGYHVKLTIHADGSQGADTKHKVFWVQPCEQTSGDTGSTTPGGDTGSTTPGGDTGSTTPGGNDTEVQGEQATSNNGGSTTNDTEVAGEQASTGGNQTAGQQAARGGNNNLPTQVEAGGNVLDWVLSPVPLMIIALGAALLAFGIVSRRRRA